MAVTRRSRAVLYQALVRDEAERAGAVPARISLDEARQRYEARPGEFNKITAVWVRTLIGPGSGRDGTPGVGGAELGRRRSSPTIWARPTPSASIPGCGGRPTTCAPTGDTLGPVRLTDGRDVILRAIKVEMAVAPFDDRMAREVQNRLAHEREEAAVRRLADELVPRGKLETFDDELMRLPE